MSAHGVGGFLVSERQHDLYGTVDWLNSILDPFDVSSVEIEKLVFMCKFLLNGAHKGISY